MKPHKTLVLVKPKAADEISSGGIYIPETAKHRKNVGEIVAIGNGTNAEPMLLKTGMTVYNIKDCGVPVDVDGETHYLIQQRDILAQNIA